MWEAARDSILKNKSIVYMGLKAIKYSYNSSDKNWIVTTVDKNNFNKEIFADIVICSAPMRDVGNSIDPEIKCLNDVKKLNYRDYITVAVLIDHKKIIVVIWIYIHEKKN